MSAKAIIATVTTRTITTTTTTAAIKSITTTTATVGAAAECGSAQTPASATAVARERWGLARSASHWSTPPLSAIAAEMRSAVKCTACSCKKALTGIGWVSTGTCTSSSRLDFSPRELSCSGSFLNWPNFYTNCTPVLLTTHLTSMFTVSFGFGLVQ